MPAVPDCGMACGGVHSMCVKLCCSASTPCLLHDFVCEVSLHSVLKLRPVLELTGQGISLTIHICSEMFLPIGVLLLSCMLVSTVFVFAM